MSTKRQKHKAKGEVIEKAFTTPNGYYGIIEAPEGGREDLDRRLRRPISKSTKSTNKRRKANTKRQKK